MSPSLPCPILCWRCAIEWRKGEERRSVVQKVTVERSEDEIRDESRRGVKRFKANRSDEKKNGVKRSEERRRVKRRSV